jgi:hypothetical protein
VIFVPLFYIMGHLGFYVGGISKLCHRSETDVCKRLNESRSVFLSKYERLKFHTHIPSITD